MAFSGCTEAGACAVWNECTGKWRRGWGELGTIWGTFLRAANCHVDRVTESCTKEGAERSAANKFQVQSRTRQCLRSNNTDITPAEVEPTSLLPLHQLTVPAHLENKQTKKSQIQSC